MNKVILLPKLFLAYLIYFFTPNKNRNIILVSEKKEEARDNGYYFFKYAMSVNNNNVYYIIRRESSDINKLEEYIDNVIFLNSFKHYYYYFLSSKMVSSQSYLYPISKSLCQKIFKSRKKKLYWLQHGVTKDYEEKMDYKYSDNVSLVCCASNREKQFFVEDLNYPKSVAQNIGFCRFDGLIDLSNQENESILIMPTFRKWLSPNDYDHPTNEEINRFMDSTFFTFYNNILNSNELIRVLEEKNIDLIFYLHYAFQPYASLFNSKSAKVKICKKDDYDVQMLMKITKIMITDFSSVAFDYAYMRKPVIYAQFDNDEYRKNHYGKGYFSYENDGFGPIINNHKQLVSSLIDYIDNNYLMEQKYIKRADDFFGTKDLFNSQRVYEFVVNN